MTFLSRMSTRLNHVGISQLSFQSLTKNCLTGPNRFRQIVGNGVISSRRINQYHIVPFRPIYGHIKTYGSSAAKSRFACTRASLSFSSRTFSSMNAPSISDKIKKYVNIFFSLPVLLGIILIEIVEHISLKKFEPSTEKEVASNLPPKIKERLQKLLQLFNGKTDLKKEIPNYKQVFNKFIESIIEPVIELGCPQQRVDVSKALALLIISIKKRQDGDLNPFIDRLVKLYFFNLELLFAGLNEYKDIKDLDPSEIYKDLCRLTHCFGSVGNKQYAHRLAIYSRALMNRSEEEYLSITWEKVKSEKNIEDNIKNIIDYVKGLMPFVVVKVFQKWDKKFSRPINFRKKDCDKGCLTIANETIQNYFEFYKDRSLPPSEWSVLRALNLLSFFIQNRASVPENDLFLVLSEGYLLRAIDYRDEISYYNKEKPEGFNKSYNDFKDALDKKQLRGIQSVWKPYGRIITRLEQSSREENLFTPESFWIQPEKEELEARSINSASAVGYIPIFIGLPYYANRNLLLRTSLMKKMEEQLVNGRGRPNATTCKLVLCGIGGMGKTTLALQFALEQQDNFSHICWINGSSSMTLKESYIKLAVALGCENAIKRQGSEYDDIPGDYISIREICNIVNSSLREQSNEKGFLLILDNVDPQKIKEDKVVLPHLGGTVIFTSRSNMGWDNNLLLQITKLELKETIAWLKKELPQEEVNDLQALALKSNNNPLILHSAIRTIIARKLSVNEYLGLFDEEERVDILNQVLDVSFKYLRKEHPLAWNWMEICSCFRSNTPIPKTFLETWAKDKQIDFTKIEENLHVLGLIEDVSEKEFTVHSTVQNYVIKCSSNKLKSLLMDAQKILDQSADDKVKYPHQQTIDMATNNLKQGRSAFFTMGVAQGDSVPTDPLSEMYLGRARKLLEDSFYHEAMEYYLMVIEIEKRPFWETQNSKLCTAYIGIGHSYRGLEKHYKAITSYKQAAKLGRKVESYIGIGNAYRDIYEYQLAIQYYHKAEEEAKCTEGSCNDRTEYRSNKTRYFCPIIYKNLCKCYTKIDNTAEARIYNQRAQEEVRP